MLRKFAFVDGAEIWSYDAGTGWPRSLLIEADDTVVVATAAHDLQRIRPDGNAAVPTVSDLSASAVSLAVAPGRLLVGQGDGVVSAYRSNGTLDWRTDIGDRAEVINAEGGPLAPIYVGCWHGIVALDQKGKPLWLRETTGAVLSLALSSVTPCTGEAATAGSIRSTSRDRRS